MWTLQGDTTGFRGDRMRGGDAVALSPASSDWGQEAHVTPDVSAKFDNGIYAKMRGWIAEAGAGGATGASGAPPDHVDDTATLTITASAPGEHPSEVAVSDAHGEEWAPHILRIVPAAPAE